MSEDVDDIPTDAEIAASSGGAPKSGKLLLRIPPDMHDEIALEAEASGVSANQLVISMISYCLGRRHGIREAIKADR